MIRVVEDVFLYILPNKQTLSEEVQTPIDPLKPWKFDLRAIENPHLPSIGVNMSRFPRASVMMRVLAVGFAHIALRWVQTETEMPITDEIDTDLKSCCWRGSNRRSFLAREGILVLERKSHMHPGRNLGSPIPGEAIGRVTTKEVSQLIESRKEILTHQKTIEYTTAELQEAIYDQRILRPEWTKAQPPTTADVTRPQVCMHVYINSIPITSMAMKISVSRSLGAKFLCKLCYSKTASIFDRE